MTPQTASSLSQVLRETWNQDMFKHAYDLELQGLQRDMQRDIQHQYRGAVASVPVFHTPSTSPQALRARKARQQEMLQLLAARQRKGKPSYRQRQKNGRAGRKK